MSKGNTYWNEKKPWVSTIILTFHIRNRTKHIHFVYTSISRIDFNNISFIMYWKCNIYETIRFSDISHCKSSELQKIFNDFSVQRKRFCNMSWFIELGCQFYKLAKIHSFKVNSQMRCCNQVYLFRWELILLLMDRFLFPC